MPVQRQSMWTYVKASYQLATSCFFALRAATALVILAELAIAIVADPLRGTDSSAEEMTSFVVDLVDTIVLSPYAILIHRRIILHDMASSYLAAARNARVVRFVGATLLFVFANALLTRALALAESSQWFALIAMICAIAYAIFFLRIFLAFPAIATDGSSAPFSDSFRDSKGSSWWLCFLFILAGIPIATFAIGLAYYLGEPSKYNGLWWLAEFGTAVLEVFSYAWLVALASYLYATRSEWTSTHHRYPIGVRLIVRVIAMLVIVPATYFFVYWVPFSIPFGNSGIRLLCAAGVGWYVWTTGMRLTVRVIAMLVVVPATYFIIYWVAFSTPFSNSGIFSLLCAAGVGWYAWKKLGSTPADLFSCTLLGAIVLGAIGFCAGFFGPIILASGGNQAPLLGIFITGPLGFILGAIGGFVYWLAKGSKTGAN